MSKITQLDSKIDYIPPATGKEVALQAEARTRVNGYHAEAQNTLASIYQVLEDRNEMLADVLREAKRAKSALKDEFKELGLVK